VAPAPVVVPVPTPTPVVVPTPIVPVIPTTPIVVSTPVSTNAEFKDGTYTGNGTYSFPGGNVNYSVSITIASGKITQASFVDFTVSGNGKYTRAQGDAALQKLIGGTSANIDTVTGATGTSKAIQDAVNVALSKAKSTVTASTQANTTKTADTNTKTVSNNTITPVLGPVVTPNTHKNIPTSSVQVASASHTTPNGKEYAIHQLSTGAYIFERPDGTISSQKFTNYQNAVNFIDKNNRGTQEIGAYIAPNGKRYTILNDTASQTYMF